MSIHKEISFENEICDHLAQHGWLYEDKDAQHYDRELALYPNDVAAWVQQTQPEAWKTLAKSHGEKAVKALCERLRVALDQRGTLEVLRHGFQG